MKKIYYIILVLLVLLAFVASFVFINQDKLADRFIRNQSENVAYRYDLLEKDDILRVVTVGTGSPLPSERVNSCNAVLVNGLFLVFDIGPGSSRAMEDYQLPLDKVEAVFISHWHTDHYLDLPELINRSWLLNRKNELNVYGPPPLDTMMLSINQLLAPDNKFRELHHGAELMDPSYALAKSNQIELDENGYRKVFEKDGVVVEAFSVDHSPVDIALGYKVSYKDKVLVLSGDTRKSPQVIKYAKGADILIHNALDDGMLSRAAKIQTDLNNTRNAKILQDVTDYHASPIDAAEVAAESGVERLILSHLGPSPENPISRSFYQAGMDDIYKGQIILAEDGDVFIIE